MIPDLQGPLVVGVDASGHADHALAAAADLAAVTGSDFALLHAVDLPTAAWFGLDAEWAERATTESLDAARARVEAWARERAAALGLEPDALVAKLELRVGRPAEALAALAEERRADTVVLGSHQRRGLVDFGSTAREALASRASHVWVQPVEYRRPRKLLVPIDMSDASVGALRLAVALAGRLGASVTTLHSFESPELYAEPEAGSPVGFPTYVVDDLRDKQRAEFSRVVAGVDWKGVEHEPLFVEGYARHEILERQDDCDLIVLATHGRTGLRRLLLGNVAYEVISRAEVPVLAWHPTRD